MRETTNIKLTQFDGTDVPNWLDQYNSDMSKIDAAFGSQNTENSKVNNELDAIKQLETADREQINENTQDIATLKQTTIPAIDTRLKAVENETGTVDARIEAVEDGLTSVETTIGDKSIANVGASITAAIGNSALNRNTLSSSISALENGTSIATGSATETSYLTLTEIFLKNIGNNVLGNIFRLTATLNTDTDLSGKTGTEIEIGNFDLGDNLTVIASSTYVYDMRGFLATFDGTKLLITTNSTNNSLNFKLAIPKTVTLGNFTKASRDISIFFIAGIKSTT